MNFFIGENGQGKSNLLEAIYANIKGKSFRSYSQRKDWIPETPKITGPKTRVHLKAIDNYGFENELALALDYEPKTIWKFFLNQKPSRTKSIGSKISIIVFSPDDHELIRGPAEKRREFLDDLLCDICPGYEETLSRFEKSLKSRNGILKKLKENKNSLANLNCPTQSLWNQELESWSRVFSIQAQELVSLRAELWPQLESRFCKVAIDRGGFGDQQVRAHYFTDPFGRYQNINIKPQSEDFYKTLKMSFDVDLATGWTHRGPHRDDIHIVFGELEGKTQASQGQSRVLAFLLKWMHADWVKDVQGEDPILLLDDFSSELDALRRSQLLELITQTQGQVFLTATELFTVDFSALSEYTYFKVQKGSFYQEKPEL